MGKGVKKSHLKCVIFLQAGCTHVALQNNNGNKSIPWDKPLWGNPRPRLTPVLKALAAFLIPGRREPETVAFSSLSALGTGAVWDHTVHLLPVERRSSPGPGQKGETSSWDGLHADSDGESRKPDSTPTQQVLRAYCVPGPRKRLSRWPLMHLHTDPMQEGLLNGDPGRSLIPVSGAHLGTSHLGLSGATDAVFFLVLK